MLTNDQLASIGGESVFEFQAFLGCGHSAVNVSMAYEYDSSGTYNETITAILTMSDIDIIDYIEDETIDQLCMRGCMLLTEKEIY